MRALGVAPLAAHLRGLLPLKEAVATAKADTRKYAKRQRAWLGRNMVASINVKTQFMERFIGDELPLILHGVDPASSAR
jgi:tRNA dimethylallyltransferase